MSGTSSSELPLPDYDHLTLGALETRLHGLGSSEIGLLLDFEHAHAARLPVLTLLENRQKAVLNGADVSARASEGPTGRSDAPGSGSAVTPATSGPPVNPPSHGVPTNPAQPR